MFAINAGHRAASVALMLGLGACSDCERALREEVEADAGDDSADAVDAGRQDDHSDASPASVTKQKGKVHTEEQLPQILPSDRQALKPGLLGAQVIAWYRGRDVRAERKLIQDTLNYREYFVRAASFTGIDPYILAGVAMTESRSGLWLISKRGATGIMQILNPSDAALKAAADALGVDEVAWKTNHYHNVVLGAFILLQYASVDDRIEFGLIRYHNGPNVARLKLKRFTEELAEFQTQVKYEKCHDGKRLKESPDECRRRKDEIIGYPLEVLGHALALRAATNRFGDTMMSPRQLRELQKNIKVPELDGDATQLVGVTFPGITAPWRSATRDLVYFVPPPPVTSSDQGTVVYERRDGKSLELVAELFRTRVEHLKGFNDQMPVARLRGERAIVVPGRNLRMVYDAVELASALYPDLPADEAIRYFMELNGDGLRYNGVIVRPIVTSFEAKRLAPKNKVEVERSIQEARRRMAEIREGMRRGMLPLEKRLKREEADPPSYSGSLRYISAPYEGGSHVPPAAD